MLDAVHQRRSRPHHEKIVRCRRQETLERTRIGLAPIHPVGRAGLVENDRHAVMNRLKLSIGCRRDNGERRLPLTGPRLPCFEESGEEEQSVICRMNP
jgi:hypothetical protein